MFVSESDKLCFVVLTIVKKSKALVFGLSIIIKKKTESFLMTLLVYIHREVVNTKAWLRTVAVTTKQWTISTVRF